MKSIVNKTIRNNKLNKTSYTSLIIDVGFHLKKQNLGTEALYLSMLLEQQKEIELLNCKIRKL